MNRLISRQILLTCALTVIGFSSYSQNTYYAVSPEDDTLRLIDLSAGTVLSSVGVTMTTSDTVQNLTGIAEHPLTGEIYALVGIVGQAGRELATLNTTTGVATSIGNTGDNFAAISFNNAGILYGVTGDGATATETLFTLNIFTGVSTMVMALGDGDDGETIAINTDNNLIYHCSGIDVGRIVESINPPSAPSPISYFGDNYNESTALFYAGGGEFIIASWERFYSMSVSGLVTALDTTNFNFPCKGLIRAEPLGIGEEDVISVNELILYPNPAGDKIYVKTDQYLGEDYVVLSMNGEVVLSGILENELDLSSLSSGIYVVKLTSLPNVEVTIDKK
jgi:hypothetical protein